MSPHLTRASNPTPLQATARIGFALPVAPAEARRRSRGDIADLKCLRRAHRNGQEFADNRRSCRLGGKAKMPGAADRLREFNSVFWSVGLLQTVALKRRR